MPGYQLPYIIVLSFMPAGSFVGVSRIPRSSASQLLNKTVPIPDDEGYYVNMIRKRIWSTETYKPDDELMGIEHLQHCNEAKAVAEIAHTYRNFEDIRVWAKENQVKDFDRTIYVEDSA
ncbi:hypothetical protein E5D57_013543 [Metarhizium anisopliae]|nr:hypothetical protein E5D57_013543 [Metarhizium anisopliae]